MIFSDVFVIASGFRENEGHENGQYNNWLTLRELANRSRFVHPPIRWNQSGKDMACFIDRVTDRGGKINVVAYSWGAGVFFVEFVKHLKKLGRTIDHAVLIDPVYRSRIMPKWLPFNPTSMTRLGKIDCHKNVRKISLFRQDQDRPSGREVKNLGYGKIVTDRKLDYGHSYMDDAREVQEELKRTFMTTTVEVQS